MRRQLDFYSKEPGAVAKLLRQACELGARKGVIIGDVHAAELSGALRDTAICWSERACDSLPPADIGAAEVVLIGDENAAAVTRALHACINTEAAVIAPVTQHHFSRRTLFLLSMPKAGTHMAIRLLGLMGLDRSSDRGPRPGTWCTPVGYEYHAPCRELMANDWFDPLGRQLLLRSPALFVYRDPRDIVVSELDWFVKPEHAFSSYLNRAGNSSERLERLIADDSVMGSIRDRVNRFVGWIHFSNVIPVSYEELVGSRGGGSDGEQCDAIWSLQLKLHIPGNPQEYGARLYDPSSATFSQGRIGRHRECFAARHYALFDALPQDFMQALGYERNSTLSSKVAERRHRALEVKEILPELLFLPRLVRQGVMGSNIIELAGSYYPVQQGEQLISAVDAKAFLADRQGFATLRDAIDAVIRGSKLAALPSAAGEDKTTALVAESYCGFNVVRHDGRWYGFDQAAGPLNLDGLGEPALEQMKRTGTCVDGENLADVKAEILRRMVQNLEQIDRQQAEQSQEAYAGLKQEVEKIRVGLQQAEQSQEAYAGLKQEVEKIRARLPAELETSDQPRLLDDGYRGFSLVGYERKVWAVWQEVGPIDLSDEARRNSFVSQGRILAGATMEAARMAVDQWCALQLQCREVERKISADLAAHVTALQREVAKIQQTFADSVEAMARQYETALQSAEKLHRETTHELQSRVQGEHQQLTRQVAVEMEMLRGQLGESAATMEKLGGELSQRLAQANGSLQNQIDDLRRNYLVRLGAYFRAKKARLTAFRNRKAKG